MLTRKQQLDFPTVAIIRKGMAKEKDRPGKDLNDHFRVVFEPGMERYKNKFKSIYGSLEPAVINAMLPFSDITECYEVSNEAYQAGMLVFKAVNGKIITYRNPESSDYLVRGGEAQREGVPTHFDPLKTTAIHYKAYDGKQKKLPIITQTRLKLFIPEMEDFVWFLLKTTSFYDSLNIQNNLAAVQAVAMAATGGNVAGVRINVFRAQQDILWNSDKGPRRIKKWLVQVKVDPDWVKKMVVRMSTNTLNAGTQVLALNAPSTAPDPEYDQDAAEYDDDEFMDALNAEFPDITVEKVEEPKVEPTAEEEQADMPDWIEPIEGEVVEEESPGATQAPENVGEFYTWANDGQIPNVDIKIAKQLFMKHEGNLSRAWDEAVKLAKYSK